MDAGAVGLAILCIVLKGAVHSLRLELKNAQEAYTDSRQKLMEANSSICSHQHAIQRHRTEATKVKKDLMVAKELGNAALQRNLGCKRFLHDLHCGLCRHGIWLTNRKYGVNQEFRDMISLLRGELGVNPRTGRARPEKEDDVFCLGDLELRDLSKAA